MFGLHNFRGSCWVNACLQGLFRVPPIQQRYTDGSHDKENVIEESLHKIWNSKGSEGLKEFFDAVRTHTMPAGHGIGDSHELLQYLCDKVPYIDSLFRFKMADSIQCNSCQHKDIKEDSVTEFSLATGKKKATIIECIAEVVNPVVIEEWKCEKCGNQGCTKQLLIGEFPKVLTFHTIPLYGSVEYTSMLGINKRQYALNSVICFNGAHWWAYGRDMPPGSSWYTLDDTRVHAHNSKQFPLSDRARLLIYYRLEN